MCVCVLLLFFFPQAISRVIKCWDLFLVSLREIDDVIAFNWQQRTEWKYKNKQSHAILTFSKNFISKSEAWKSCDPDCEGYWHADGDQL